MGWLFGKKKDDELYRGDAPASAPGLDGGQPAAYQGNASGRPYDPGSIGTPSPYPTAAAGSYQPSAREGTEGLGQPVAIAHAQPSGIGASPELAAAMALAANQQRMVRRTLTRSLLGLLLPVVLVGGLVVVGFVVVDRVPDGIVNPFGSGPAPDQPFEGVVGTPGDVTLGENSYRITIQNATAQPSAAWGSYSAPVSGGFLMIELSLTRTDTNAEVSQISWFDWTFTSESDPAVEGALIAGGYEPLLSTLNLQPDESTTGLIAFDTIAAVGTLSLTTYEGLWAQWPIAAATPSVVTGAFGVPIHPEAAGAPFSATVSNPRWIGAADPAVLIDPSSGSYLVLDLSVTVDEGALGSASSLSVGYDNWEFTPNGGATVSSSFGANGAASLTFSPGQPTTASTLIVFDAAPSPGTLSLVNADGSVLATWQVPAP